MATITATGCEVEGSDEGSDRHGRNHPDRRKRRANRKRNRQDRPESGEDSQGVGISERPEKKVLLETSAKSRLEEVPDERVSNNDDDGRPDGRQEVVS